MDDAEMAYENQSAAMRAALDDFEQAIGQLEFENRRASLSQPSFVTLPPDPPLHRLARRATANELSGTVTGPVAQAGSVSGGIHFHQDADSHPVTPWQMPGVPARFVNRSRELAALDDVLLGVEPRCASVLLSGPAGVGKSALARSWLGQRHNHFPDGVLYADLHGRDDPLTVYRVLCSFLSALGVPFQRMPADIDSCAAVLRSLTAAKQLAVLLEGAASSTHVRPLLLTGTGTTMLITSTRRLDLLLLDGVHLLAIEPLQQTAAAELLERFAGPARISGQAEAARRITHFCAGLPLALCVIGAQLAAHPERDLEPVANQLSDENGRLRRLTLEGKPVVHHALDTGYRALPPDAARLYRLLGALPIDAFTAPVAAAVAQASDQHAATLLGALADAHLLREAEAGVYRFYPLTALHARETHEPGEELDTPVDRVIAWYVASAVNAAGTVRPYRREAPVVAPVPLLRPAAFTELGAALDWLDAEAAQLLALARHCAQQQRWRTALEMVGSMWALFAYRKYYPLWEQFDTLGLACARAAADQDAQARMLRRLGLLCTDLGRYREAREYLQDAAALFEQLGDEHRVATVLNSLGVVELRDGDPAAAVRQFTSALAIHQERGEIRQTALVLIDVADAEIERGRIDIAIAYLREATEHLEGSPDAYTLARLRMLLGRAHSYAAATEDAEHELHAALETMDQAGSAFGRAEALFYLAELAARTGRPELAEHRCAEAAALLHQLGAPRSGWLATRITSRSLMASRSDAPSTRQPSTVAHTPRTAES